MNGPSASILLRRRVAWLIACGATFMVVYGSYLTDQDSLTSNAWWTTFGDTFSGLLAGLAIFPAVFSLGLTPNNGPGLIFATLPKVFAAIPAGWLFGLLFFIGLLGAGYLSGLAAFEVLVAALTDNTRLSRTKVVWLVAIVVFVVSIPPMINNRIFVPWDLTFGSGMQTLGAIVAAVTVGWALDRREAIAALSAGGSSDGAPGPRPEYTAGYYAAFVRDPEGNKIEAVTFVT